MFCEWTTALHEHGLHTITDEIIWPTKRELRIRSLGGDHHDWGRHAELNNRLNKAWGCFKKHK